MVRMAGFCIIHFYFKELASAEIAGKWPKNNTLTLSADQIHCFNYLSCRVVQVIQYKEGTEIR